MFYQFLVGGLVSLINFGIHALMTGLIVIVTRHVAGRTDDLHVFMRVSSLLPITVAALMVAHVSEIAVWAGFYSVLKFPILQTGTVSYAGGYLDFAFENYVALGYGDAVAGEGWRLIGPITALNGLLLIGWSVALIFEVMRMAEVQVGRAGKGRR
jgi:hypothetical protein